MTTRLVHVDALRGFALCGILVVNIAFFASGYAFHLVDDPGFTSGTDQAAHWLVRLRMALTNYLGQSLLAVGVFTGVGLGLVGRVGPATVVRAVTNAERPDNVPR